jgi:hypothetical protein
MNHHIFNNLFILLILFFSSTSLFSKTTINVFHTFKESGLHIQELKNSIVLNYNSKGLLIDSTIYSHTTPLNKKYVYVTGKEERLKLERTFKKEVILSYLFEYNKAGKKMSITLYGNDDNILWKEFLKYDSNQNLIKRLKYDPSKAINPEMMTSQKNSNKTTWAEIYDYDSTGTVLTRKEIYNDYILVITTFDIDSLNIPKKRSEYFDPSIILQTTLFHNSKNQIRHEITVDRFGKSLGSKKYEYDFLGRKIKKIIYNETGLTDGTLRSVYDDDNFKFYDYHYNNSMKLLSTREVILDGLDRNYIELILEGDEKVLEKSVYYYDKKNRISKIKKYDMVRKGKEYKNKIPIILHTYEYD